MRLLAGTDYNEVIASGDEIDIADEDSVMNFVEDHRPQLIVNCAAFTDVDLAEWAVNRTSVWRANAWGPRHLGVWAEWIGASVLHFSTDYVFDGNRSANEIEYRESSKHHPINEYGKSKSDGEWHLTQSGAKHWIVRTSSVFSATHSCFVKRVIDKLHEGPAFVVDDQYCRPTYADDLALRSLAMCGAIKTTFGPLPHGTWNFTNDGPAISKLDWARMIRRHLLQWRDLPEGSVVGPVDPNHEAPWKHAKRPSRSTLCLERSFAYAPRPRHYEDALAVCIQQMNHKGLLPPTRR